MRVLFAGTPDVAVTALDVLAASRHDVVAVLTRPNAPWGRGRRLEPTPVRRRAAELGIPVLTPSTLRTSEVEAQVADLELDVAAVVAYGALIPPALLEVPRHGWLNLHFSLLPSWRGAAPVQRAIWHGDRTTGASVFRIEEGLDTGPIFGQLTTKIGPAETTGDLLGRLARDGATLLASTLDGLDSGTAVPTPQDSTGATHAPRLTADDGRIRWHESSDAIDRRVRACTPSPGAWTTTPGRSRLKVGKVAPIPARELPEPIAPGEIRVSKHDVVVGTQDGAVRLSEVAPAGKRFMPASDWARGARLETGTVLGGDVDE